MNIVLIQEIAPSEKVASKYNSKESISSIKMKTAWKVDDDIWSENRERAFNSAQALRPALMFVDGEWKPTEVLEPASRWSLSCAIANAFCEYTGLQLFKRNYMLARPELAGKEVPHDPAHNERLCHMCVRSMFGGYPDEMDKELLDDLCHFTSWEIVSEELQDVGKASE